MVHPHPVPGASGCVRGQLVGDPGPTDRPSHHGHRVTRTSSTASESPSVGIPAARASSGRSAGCSSCVGTGQVVIPRGHGDVRDGLQEGQVLPTRSRSGPRAEPVTYRRPQDFSNFFGVSPCEIWVVFKFNEGWMAT